VGAELFLQRFSLVVVLAGLVWLILGTSFLRQLLFPLAFLGFMIPLPAIVLNAVAFPLQQFAAQSATFCMQLAGIPVLREGKAGGLFHPRRGLSGLHRSARGDVGRADVRGGRHRTLAKP
jgi:exosortase